MSYLQNTIAIFLAYLTGSISSAIIVCQIMHLPDPRTLGSRNPGATNVLRIGGKKAAIITLLGDLLKGVIPVLIAKWLGFDNISLAFITLAAFLGHLFPIFFRFEGGKGVATALGGMLALSWPVGICWISTWLLIAILSRYASLSSIVASLIAPFYAWYFTHQLVFVAIIGLISFILIIRHRSNIEKLMSGQENKIGKKPTHRPL